MSKKERKQKLMAILKEMFDAGDFVDFHLHDFKPMKDTDDFGIIITDITFIQEIEP